ncbi:hypothetical protein ACFQ3N_02290 [Virgibacillus byunsanensis]|uniref:Type II toxin-antitoxin system RelE/ParE family toxin n=1 Tax=Virgibacillus byunsanensis TaxID=570945 RepID=A0ABW3LJ67_9BACI
MREGNKFRVLFTEEFILCLDHIQDFFANQNQEVLEWWYQKEDEIIDYISDLLSIYPLTGVELTSGPFKGLRQLTYGKSRHRMLNYVIYYAVYVDDYRADVINMLPTRSKRKRV